MAKDCDCVFLIRPDSVDNILTATCFYYLPYIVSGISSSSLHLVCIRVRDGSVGCVTQRLDSTVLTCRCIYMCVYYNYKVFGTNTIIML